MNISRYMFKKEQRLKNNNLMEIKEKIMLKKGI